MIIMSAKPRREHLFLTEQRYLPGVPAPLSPQLSLCFFSSRSRFIFVFSISMIPFSGILISAPAAERSLCRHRALQSSFYHKICLLYHGFGLFNIS